MADTGRAGSANRWHPKCTSHSPMKFIDLFLSELDREVKRSRRALEMVPSDKRDWKPHEKSMELGRLADMVATIPTWFTMIIKQDELDVAPKDGGHRAGPQPKTSAEYIAALESSAKQAKETLESTSEAHLQKHWKMLAAGQVVADTPRHEVLRDTMNHWASYALRAMAHVLGTLTDLDARIAGRAVASLGAELRRRERVLAEHGARSIEECRRGSWRVWSSSWTSSPRWWPRMPNFTPSSPISPRGALAGSPPHPVQPAPDRGGPGRGARQRRHCGCRCGSRTARTASP